jgi:uncharacterized protein YegL
MKREPSPLSSVIRKTNEGTKPQSFVFMTPEMMNASTDLVDDDVDQLLEQGKDWDIATRYHEFKSKKKYKSDEALLKKLRKLSAQAILSEAQKRLGSVTRKKRLVEFYQGEAPADVENVEINLETTLEEELSTPTGLWFEGQVNKKHFVNIVIDTSLSMTGEKLALTAVAVAMVLLQFHEDSVGVIAFENDSKTIKFPDEMITIEAMVERFLDIPAQGYTHLENGLLAALKMQTGRHQKSNPVTILLTDGKYTAGKDPGFLAPRFNRLDVIKMGNEKAGLPLCQELAQRGKGQLRQVDSLKELPSVMLSVVKDLLRQ